MPPLPARRRVLLIALTILAGLLLCAWLAGRYAERQTLGERSGEAQAQLALYAQNIHTLVERFRSVPALLALDRDILALLEEPLDLERRQALSERLQRLNAAAGSTVLYLLDAEGQTLSASNWHEPSSFVGYNYAFRPYFQDAVRHGSGHYFAVGVTTGVPGYFLSQAVRDSDGRLIGVLVVKLEMEQLQREWVMQPGVLLVADAHRIVILSNRPAWRFAHLAALSDPERLATLQARKYAEQPLHPLTTQTLERLDAHSERRRVDGPDGRHDYLWTQLALPEEGWTLHLLQAEPVAGADVARSFRLAAGGLWMTLAFLVLFLVQRRHNRRLRQRSRAELEQLVEARTAELHTAQDELVQAAKLAALGQMSAALAHELNQPLTALRMQLASLRLLAEQGRTEQAAQVLQRAEALLERMAALTGHLKTFARKSPAGLGERLALGHVLEQALALLAPRLRSEQVELQVQIPDTAWVIGDAIRLEQVLVNLLQNALDAMREAPQRQLRIDARRIDARHDGACWQLSVADSGGGIAAEHLGNVFDPFFTTKPVGQGLGLGLAVSYGIVRDLGGSLEAGNDAQGAVFRLRLPAAPEISQERQANP